MAKLICLNIAGLKAKQNRVSRLVIENNNNIICIQEIHKFDQEFIHYFEKEVQGIFYTNIDEEWTGIGNFTKK